MQSNNYLNQKFDLILFDIDDTEGFSCYAKAVFHLDWNTECTFSDKTRVYKSVDHFSDWLDGLDQIDELSGKIVIDNSPLPHGGAFSDDPLTAMVSIRSNFEMTYNIKHLTIYGGLACLLLLFILLGQCYLWCKLRGDTSNKRKKLAEECDDYSAGSKLLPKTE